MSTEAEKSSEYLVLIEKVLLLLKDGKAAEAKEEFLPFQRQHALAIQNSPDVELSSLMSSLTDLFLYDFDKSASVPELIDEYNLLVFKRRGQ